MKASGECPVCRTQHAWEQEAIAAAHSMDCGCETELRAFPWADGDEIGICCPGCGSEHVFHAAGAGEIVRCRCGESLDVPTHRLIVSDSEATPEPEPIEEEEAGAALASTHSGTNPIAEKPEAESPSVSECEDETDASEPSSTVMAEEPKPADSEPSQSQVSSATPISREREVEPKTNADRDAAKDVDATTEEPSSDSREAEPVARLDEASTESSDQCTVGPIDVAKHPETEPSLRKSPTLSPPKVEETAVAIAPEQSPVASIGHLPSTQLPTEFAFISQVSADTATQLPATPEGPTQSLPRHEMTIQCPACQTEYLVPRTEEGQTAECECGFVFLQKPPAVVEATDALLRSDLLPGLALHAKGLPVPTGTVTPATTSLTELSPIRPIRNATNAVTQTNQSRSIAAVRAVVHAGLTLAAAFMVGFFIMQWISDPSRRATAQEGNRDGATARPLVVQRADPIAPLRRLIQDFGEDTPLELDQLRRFGSAVAELESQRDRLKVEDVFWVAQSWQRLGDRVPRPELAVKCYQQAATAYAFAKAIAPPQSPGGDVAEQRMRAMLADAKPDTSQR